MIEQEQNLMELDESLNNRLISNNDKKDSSSNNDSNNIDDTNVDEVIEETVGDAAVGEDDDVLKGVAIGDNEEFLNDDDDDDDDGPIFHISKIQKANGNTPSVNRRLSSDRGSKSYVRPQQPQLMSNNETQNETDDKNVNTNDDEIKKLRFPHHRTAFDIVLDDLDVNETPWRSKQTPVDLSDYFNYGFNEHSWKIYAERQLKYRAYVLKLGPPALYARPVSQQVPAVPLAAIDDYEEPDINESKTETVEAPVIPVKQESQSIPQPPPSKQFQPPMFPPGVQHSMFPQGAQPPMFPQGAQPPMFPQGAQPHHMWGMDPRFGMQGMPQPPQNMQQGGPQQSYQRMQQGGQQPNEYHRDDYDRRDNRRGDDKRGDDRRDNRGGDDKRGDDRRDNKKRSRSRDRDSRRGDDKRNDDKRGDNRRGDDRRGRDDRRRSRSRDRDRRR